jgi:hypothetical protein
MRSETRPDTTGAGIVITLLLHATAVALLILFPGIRPMGRVDPLGHIVLIGLTQFVYMPIAALLAFLFGRRRIALGLVIGATLTFLINLTCYGTLWLL